jgi:hypothetical protein
VIGALCATTDAVAAALPRSDYEALHVCRAPTAGRAACLALRLEPRTTAARARLRPLTATDSPQVSQPNPAECAEHYAASCLTPAQLRSAYFPGESPEAPASEPQTIALVDAYNDPNAAADLATYENAFELHECSAQNCFERVNRSGETGNLPFPKTNAELQAFAKSNNPEKRAEAEEAEGWSLEIATDIEMARAICHNCHILLVEAPTERYSDLEAAEDTAATTLHATEISNSWGGPEPGTESEAFNHPGIPITGAAGDDGYLNWDQYATRGEAGSAYFEGADYPASLPHVISIGGTRLSLTLAGAWQGESAWNSESASEGAGGSGCSATLPAPEWQRKVSDWAQVGCGERRANADISADAEPTTGVNVYDSTPYPSEIEKGVKLNEPPGWVPIGGTSVASPIIASMFALAGGAHGVAYPAQTLYSHLGSALLHDVTSGGNGECDDNYSSSCSGSLISPVDCGPGAWICNTTSGYDGPTGVGTPNGIGAFVPVAGAAKGGGGNEPGEEGKQTGKPPEEPGKSGTGERPTEGSGSGAGQNTGSGGGGTVGSSSGSTGSGGAPAPGGSVTSANAAIRISALALTANAHTALRHKRPLLSELAFSCTLSRAATVRVTLAVRVRAGGRQRWHTLSGSFTFAADKGLNRRRLHGSTGLTPGVYRLRLTSAGGSSRSIVIRLS